MTAHRRWLASFFGFIALIAVSTPASAEWFATLKLPYNTPGYLAQWVADPQQILLTLNNHSAAPASIVFELVAQSDAVGEIFRGNSIPFVMVNNAPRAFRTLEVIRWNEVIWNPALRGKLANAHRVPEGEINICVRVYEWNGVRGTQLAEACAKSSVTYPDVPQPTSPKDDAHVTGAAVNLAWTAPQVPPEITLQYRVDIAELPEGGSPDAALAKPLYSATAQQTSTSVIWGKPLKQGAAYCWRATALDQYGWPATAHAGNSRIVKFHYDAPDDRETDRLLARLKKNVLSFVAQAKTDPAAAPLVTPVEADLATGASGKAFNAVAAKLRIAADSLALTASSATMEAIAAALGNADRAVFATAGTGSGPYDSVVAICQARAQVMRKVSSPAIQPQADSIILLLNAVHKATAIDEVIPRALAAHQHAIALFALGNAESPVWHDRLQSLLFTTASLLRTVWPAGGALAEAEFHTVHLQQSAAKKGADQIAGLRKMLVDALAASSESAANTSYTADDSRMYDALRTAGSTLDALRASWKGSPEGLHDIDSVREDVDSCGAIMVRNRGSLIGGLYLILARAQSAAGKKGAADFEKPLAECHDALTHPMNAALQVQTVTNVRKTVLEHTSKGDKAWSAVPTEFLERAAKVATFATAISEIRTAIDAAAASAKDPGLKAASTALAVYCGDIVSRCAHADQSSTLYRDLGTPELQQRLVVDLVRDLRELSRMASGEAKSSCQRIEDQLVHGVLEKIMLQGTDMTDIRTELEKRGLSPAFGATATNSFAEIQGKTLLLNSALAEFPARSLSPLILVALRDGAGATIQSRFTTMLAGRDALIKAHGDGWYGRADIFLDAGVLGEREVTRMQRSVQSQTIPSVQAHDTVDNSPHPILQCTMQYPTSWKFQIVEGMSEKYSAFDLIGPANGANTVHAHIAISAAANKDAGFATPVEYFDAFLDKSKTLTGKIELIKRANISYWGEAVPYIDVMYMLPVPLESAAFTWTTIRERKYAINHGGMLWTFIFSADAADYEKYAPVFQHLMDTFFFAL